MIPGGYGFGVERLRIHFAAEKITDLLGIQGSHPRGKPAGAWITHPSKHPFHLEIKTHIYMRDRKAFRHETNRAVNPAESESAVYPRRFKGSKRIVSGEEFVAAVSAQGNGHILARKFGNERCREKRTVSHYLIELSCGSLRPLETSLGRNNFLVVQ